MSRDSLGSWASAIVICCALPLAAPAASGADAAGAGLRPLIDQLEAAEFSERQEASQKLVEAGPAAIPELQRAAESKSRETSDRALQILKRHFEQGDNDAQAAARAALERLAKGGGNPATARRADHVLNPPPEPTVVTAPNAVPAANHVRIQIGMANPFERLQINTREANGKRDVDVIQGRRKIKIQTFPNGRIEMEIAEPVNGKEVTRKFEAKDLNELKGKDADAGRVYEQYGGGGMPAFGVRRAQPPGLPPRIDPTERTIESLDRHIAELKERMPAGPSLERLVESLESHKQRLRERQAR
jgi:hypothetical protein